MMRRAAMAIGILVSLILCYEAVRTKVARDQTLVKFDQYLSSQAIKIKAGDLSQRQLEILLTVEDPRFFEHQGVDMQTPGAGLTTITQAIVKKFYFEDFTPGWRKVEQTLIARFAVHPLISKEDQLTVFLNSVYMGHCRENKVTGLQDAALCYYQRPFAALSQDEYIALVAMAIGPHQYHPMTAPEKHAERIRRINALLAGACAPLDNQDVYYQAC